MSARENEWRSDFSSVEGQIYHPTVCAYTQGTKNEGPVLPAHQIVDHQPFSFSILYLLLVHCDPPLSLPLSLSKGKEKTTLYHVDCQRNA